MFSEEGNTFTNLKDTHNLYWWVTLTVNRNFVYKETPQGTFNDSKQGLILNLTS